MQTPAVIPSSTSGGQGGFTDEGHVSKRTVSKRRVLGWTERCDHRGNTKLINLHLKLTYTDFCEFYQHESANQSWFIDK